MKKIYFLLFFAAWGALGLTSCQKAENKLIFEGGTSPVLTVSKPGPIVFSKADAEKSAITFSWTNPNYMFNTGLSSQNVNYILEMDLVGANFGSANRVQSSMGSDINKTFLTREINSLLNTMELKAGVPHNLEFRIKASLGSAAPLLSNVVKMTISPYLDFAVEPPGTAANNYEDGNLWAVGDAFAAGWSNPLPAPYDVSQKFTKIDVLHYELIINFIGGGGYKLIQEQGVWGTQYHALAGGDANSGSFERKDAEPGFPGQPAGRYKIQINFQTGRYTVTKQ